MHKIHNIQSTMLDRVLSQYDQTIHANFKRVHNKYVNNHMGDYGTS